MIFRIDNLTQLTYSPLNFCDLFSSLSLIFLLTLNLSKPISEYAETIQTA